LSTAEPAETALAALEVNSVDYQPLLVREGLMIGSPAESIDSHQPPRTSS